MATVNNSDFVLDDDMDEDEDILNYQSLQQRSVQLDDDPDGKISPPSAAGPPVDETLATPSATNVAPADPSSQPTVRDETSSSAQQTPQTKTTPITGPPPLKELLPPPHHRDVSTTAVIIDGLPLSARRSDLDALLGSAACDVTNVRLRRLEKYGLLRVRVEFENTHAVRSALSKDGMKWEGSTESNGDTYLSIKAASEERWSAMDASMIGATPTKDQGSSGGVSGSNNNKSNGKNELQEQLSKSFWSAVSAAKTMADKLEEQARKLGEKIENDLHVSERMRQADHTYRVSEKLEQAKRVAGETVGSVDQRLGISNGARLVAREVDENLRVSDKARDAANMAMTSSSPTVKRVARSVVSSLEGQTPPPGGASRRNYQQPQRLDFAEDGSGAKRDGAGSGGGGEEGRDAK